MLLHATRRFQTRPAKHLRSLAGRWTTVGLVSVLTFAALVGAAAPSSAASPTKVRFTQVSLGDDLALALSRGGKVYAWGSNTHDALCIGKAKTRNETTHTPFGVIVEKTRTSPALVRTPRGLRFTHVATGQSALALSSKGAVYSWPSRGNRCPVKVRLPKKVKITRIAANDYGAAALTSTGDVYQWGEFGKDFDISRPTPVKVKLPKGVTFTSLSADDFSFKALGSDGHMYAWGHNSRGQLGLGKFDDKYRPAPVRMRPPVGVEYRRAATGLALDTADRIYTWGNNYYGQLGNGTRLPCRRAPCAPRYFPAQEVVLPAGVKIADIQSGGITKFALTTDGTILAWGSNGAGAVGDGSKARYRLRPVQVKLPPEAKAVQISVEGRTALALTVGGRIYGWGQNAFGTTGGAFGNTKKGLVKYHAMPIEVG